MNLLFNKSHYRSLDPKGRLVLPQEYRDALQPLDPGGRFVLTGDQGRLVAYTLADWEETRRRLTAIKRPSQALGRFMSKFLGLAEEVAPDAQGRVRLSQPLMRAAGLQKDVVLVGMGWKFEVWDQARFEQLETEDISAELDALGVDISL